MAKNYTGFSFHMPTEIVFGKGTENKVAEYVTKYGGTKVLIVMDGGGFIKTSGLFSRIAASLDHVGIPFVELEGVQPNPNASLMLAGAAMAKEEGVDFVLGVGGGSTMDTAKAIALSLVDDGDVMDFFTHKRKPTKIGRCGAVSTIAASGSETSSSALIKDDLHTGDKGGYNNRDLRMLFAIMDPEITYTVPAFQTACGAADMFSHTFESYLTVNTSAIGDGFAETVLKTAVKFGPVAVKDPNNYEARAELLLNASMAHNDVTRIGRTGGGAAFHNIEEALGNVFHRTHGAGIALVMAPLLQAALDKDEDTIPVLVKVATRVFDVENDPLNQRETAQNGIDCLKSWLKNMGLPVTIREYAKVDSVSENQIEAVIHMCRFDAEGYYKGFGKLTRNDIHDLLTALI